MLDQASPLEIDLGRPIGVSPQLSAHVTDERRVLLLGESRSFRLGGKLYVALLPFLDGTRTGKQVVEAFAGRVAADRLRSVLQDMLKKEYIRYIDPAAPMARQALWVELGLSPAEAERRLRGQSLAVKAASRDGSLAVAAKALKQALVASGMPVVAAKDAAIVVMVVDDYLRRDLAVVNRRMRKAGRSWIPFKAGGSMPMIGPLFRPDRAPCWACLANFIVENRPGDRVVDQTLEAVRPARARTPATLAMAAGFGALELARELAGEQPAGLERHVLSFDLKERAFRRHEIRVDAGCPVCGTREKPRAVLERAKRPIVLRPQPVQPQVDGGWRTLTAEQVVQKLDRYVSPITGIISGLEDMSLGPGLPVFAARQTNPVPVGPRQNRLIGRPSGAAGKGMSEAQAKASCLAEAVERYLCGYTGREPRMRAAWDRVRKQAPHPCTYLNYSEHQYDIREEWNKANGGFNWVGERFDETRAIEWTPAWSLSRNALRWLPTRYCYFNYSDTVEGEENIFCRGDSNGCASGSTIEEAIVQGFFELIERDACALWWYNRVRRPAFDLDALDDPFVRRARAWAAARKRSVSVLDLTTDLGLPVTMAVSHSLADGGSIVFGLGAHFDPAIAVSRALAELNQLASLEDIKAIKEAPNAAGDPVDTMVEWLRGHTLETDPYCVPDGVVSAGRYAAPPIGDLKQAVERCVRAVSDRGYDMIVLDHSRAEVDFAAARVVVPGLRHFWARLREGRLYRAPVDMGWLGAPHAEADLNPVPFFL